MRQFYILFSDYQKVRTLFARLSCSHFQRVIKVQDEKARTYYLTEAAQNMWSVRTLDRNISTLYYNRLIASQEKELVIQEMKEKTANLQITEFIKNPTVLEFLNLPTNLSYTETELEKALNANGV